MLLRSSLRYLLRHPWLAGLSVLGVALGVAVVVSIDLANASAQWAFELSAERVTGKATHQIVGAGEEMDEAVYRQVRVDLGVRDVAPVVEDYVRYRGRVFQVLGIDPLADEPFRVYTGGRGSLDLAAFMARRNGVLLAQTTADEFGLAAGDTLQVMVEGRVYPLRVSGTMAPEDENSRRVLESLFVVDVATAQELFGMVGRLSRIDLIVPEGPAGEAVVARLAAALPRGVEVVRAAARTETVAQMTRAFELNLTALSLLALVVGMFLIYNTMTFSVVQRRMLIGRLRALGVTRGEVFRLVLGEAALIGLLGTTLGLALGVVLGQGLVRLVTQTINDLYYVLSVRELAVPPPTLLKGAALGLGATLLATLFPAREATRAEVGTVLRRSAEEARVRRRVPRLAVLGVLIGLAALGLLALPTQDIAVSYAALLCVLVAFALVTPAAVVLFSKALRPLMGGLFGVLGRMAARGVVATLSRTAVAVAALMVALASTIGVGVMIDSFRDTVATWLGYTLQADVYVQPPGLVFRRGDATLDPAVAARLAAVPGVGSTSSVRHAYVRTVGAGRVDLSVIDSGPLREQSIRLKAGSPEAAWRAFETGAVFVSEPYGYRYDTRVGDTLRLETDRGEQAFPVAGVFYDYGSDQGVVMMHRRTYERYYEDRGLSGLSLYAASGQDVDALIRRLQAAAGPEQELIVRSNRALRQASLEVFDRTFTITAVLRLLAVVVAFVGVLNALMALQLERAREFAVLRAEGLTPGQVWQYVTLQTGVMGLAAGFLSVPLGIVLALVLIYVINRRSFGWTLQFEVGPEVLLQALVLALLAAVLAGIYPSWRMARANPAHALREE